MNYGRRSSNEGIIVVILVIFIVMPLFLSYCSTKTYNVIVTGKVVENYNGKFKYLVFAKLKNDEAKTFCIEDSFLKKRWNALEVYNNIKVGKAYKIKVIGCNILSLDKYEDITTISITKTK